MDILATRLKERAKQLGISNAEAARRCGLDERRYAHYASGRREPDLVTLKSIAEVLGTTPNWLLGLDGVFEGDPEKSRLIERFKNAATNLELRDLRLFIVQVEAVVANEDSST